MTLYQSAFDALCDTPAESTNLKLRAELLAHLQKTIAQMTGTQNEIAQLCGITQPRLNDLLTGKINKFSLDALVNITASLGKDVHFRFG